MGSAVFQPSALSFFLLLQSVLNSLSHTYVKFAFHAPPPRLQPSRVFRGSRVVWCRRRTPLMCELLFWTRKPCLLLLPLPVISLLLARVCPQPGGLVGFSYRIASVPRHHHPCWQDIEYDLCQETEARRLSGSRGHAAPNYHLTFPL